MLPKARAEKERNKLMKRRLFTFHGSHDLKSIFRHVHPLTTHSYPTDQRYEEDRSERSEKKAQRRRDKHKDRKEKDEYSDDSENEFAEKAPRMLEAPSNAGASSADADFIRENRDRRSHREAERDVQYMSGGLGRRDDAKQQGY